MTKDIHSSHSKNLHDLICSTTNGELTLIAVQSGTDLTHTLVNLAIKFSKKSPVFYFTSKESQARLTDCLVSSLLKIPVNDLTQEHPAIASFLFPKTLNNIHIHDSCKNTMEVLKHLRCQLIEEYKIKFIVIDNLQKLCHPKIEIKFIRMIKRIVKDLGIVAIIATEVCDVG